MARDPLSDLADAPLFIVPRVLERLRAYRAGPPCLTEELGPLVDTLLAGIEAHPTRFWVMKQFQKTLDAVASEDMAVRAHVGMALGQLMDILGIDRRSIDLPDLLRAVQ